MALAVVSYPKISKKDYNWIQTIRSDYDPQYSVINPHFTLIFPLSVENQEEIIEHIEKRAEETKETFFSIKKMSTFKDSLTRNTYLFLIPELGWKAIEALHNKLYTGALYSKQNHNVPFIPHITLGSSNDPIKMQNLENNMNIRGIYVEGTLESLDIIVFDKGKPVNTLTHIRFKG
jgi:2'-5' RNA ligase